MQLISILLLAGPALAAIDAATYPYVAPKSTDSRCPCPMVNALANHGLLPHNGLNIDVATVVSVLDLALNIQGSVVTSIVSKALTASTTGNSSTFNLADLNTHNVLEHDGSLSRADSYFGNDHAFNSTIWATTKAHYTTSTISITQAAKARSARMTAAKAENPEFSLSTLTSNTYIENALMLTVFGNPTTGDAKLSWVTTMFEEEKLPFAQGWTRPTTEGNLTTLQAIAAKMVAAEATF